MAAAPLSRIDLNLLVVLDVLLREKNVGRAAEHLNLTPSAVSHALKRLRILFDNELLVRDGRRMVPTARAKVLAETLPAILGQIERAITEGTHFDPATSDRVFRLVAPDFVAPLLLRLLKQTATEAPGILVELAPYTSAAISEMKQGRYDAMIGPQGRDDEGLRGDAIGSWSWVVFGRKGHPAFADWSLDAWAKHTHVQVRTTGPQGKGPVDQAATKLGIERRIGAVVPNFAVAASALAQTDMLLTAPSITLRDAAGAYDLDVRDAPFALSPLTLSLSWNALTGDAPDVQWFLTHVRDVCAGLK